jgi:hypothetical protein
MYDISYYVLLFSINHTHISLAIFYLAAFKDLGIIVFSATPSNKQGQAKNTTSNVAPVP